jgi:transposase
MLGHDEEWIEPAIERMFCRIKDFRRIATRYDRLARNFLAAVCIAATVSYWL